MTAKRGRPKKPASQRLSIVLRHRLSREEYESLDSAAKRAGMGLSKYVRQKLFGDVVKRAGKVLKK
jgi:hypothetical protein